MCGIAGIIQANPEQYRKEHLQRMTDALAHRGPDGEGHWCNSSHTSLLGHRRLAIIDLSAKGQQPMHYLNRYTVVHNGEIYNYTELKSILEQKGYAFHTQTDTEVITAAWDHWKEDCLHYFDGMFAFAIWDEDKNELFAARDRFGEKPFYYFSDSTAKTFCFASEMKALWPLLPQGRSPNLQMLFNFITIGYTVNPENPGETFDNQIDQLPPAHYLKISLRQDEWITEKKYWSLEELPVNDSITDQQALETFTALFQTSVQRRLRSDVPIGISLSGGLDSSSIAASLSQLYKQDTPLCSFTASFPGFEKDETAAAAKLANQFGLQQHLVQISADELLKDWEKLCYHQEEPFGSASIFAQYKVYELAKQQGTKVLLDGQGADETLGGYHKYYKWYWQELFRKRKLKSSGEIPAARQLGIQEPFGWKNKIASWFPSFASIVMENHYLARALSHPGLNRDFVKQQSREAYYTPPDHFTLNGVLQFNTFTYGLQELLRYADRNSMAHGREVRLPFLSHELVAFEFSLPARFKIRHGWTKWLLRESMKEKLPAETVWRKDKTGFEPPQEQWMKHKQVQEAIRSAKEKLVRENILKPELLNQPVIPLAAHAAENYDWRYLSAALLFK